MGSHMFTPLKTLQRRCVVVANVGRSSWPRKVLLCAASEYFSALLGGTMMEAHRLMMPEQELGDDAASDEGHDGDGPNSDGDGDA